MRQLLKSKLRGRKPKEAKEAKMNPVKPHIKGKKRNTISRILNPLNRSKQNLA